MSFWRTININRSTDILTAYLHMVWSEFWAQYSALLGTSADPVVAAPEQ